MDFDNITINFGDDEKVVIDEYEVEIVNKKVFTTKQFELINKIQTIVNEL